MERSGMRWTEQMVWSTPKLSAAGKRTGSVNWQTVSGKLLPKRAIQ
jgi:hypothetical protein